MIPSLMRAAVRTETASQVQRIEELPVPTPGRGEVLVEVAGCGVCHTDLHVLKSEVAFPAPAVLGHEISGTVAALGPGVARYDIGQRVVGAFVMPCGQCSHCAKGRDDLCLQFFGLNRLRGVLYDGQTRLFRGDGSPVWMYSMGGLAQFAVVPEFALQALPDSLPLIESAVLGCALLTAYGAVRHAADLRVGDHLAVIGVGGVGGSILQMARAFGASQLIAIDIKADKLELARRLGATDLVDAAKGDPVEQVLSMTSGRGVDVAFEALGQERTFEQAVAMVTDGGRMVAVGIAAAGTAARIDITRLVRRSLRVQGSYGARTRTDLPAVVELAARGIADPKAAVTRRFSLDEVNEAYELLARGQIAGRGVICPNA